MTDTHKNNNERNCLFCKIVKGDIPCHVVYEDEDYFGFLDINPKTKGDTLLIPKSHHRWTYDVPDFGGYWETVRKLSKKIMKAMGADWVNYYTYGGITHAHIHILPRYGEINPQSEEDVIPKIIQLSEKEFKEIAGTIRGA